MPFYPPNTFQRLPEAPGGSCKPQIAAFQADALPTTTKARLHTADTHLILSRDPSPLSLGAVEARCVHCPASP